MIALLLTNFILMPFDAKEITSGQRVIRAWTQTAADFVQSPVTTVTSSVTNYFGSIATLRSAQSENDELKQQVQELQVQLKQKEDLDAENKRLRSLLGLKDQSKYSVLPARIIGLVWHRDRHRSAAAEAFVDTALEVCAALSQGMPADPRGPREPVPQSA